MFKKNLRIAFRNFNKNKASAVINIIGLAVGISASLIIFLIVRYDFSFDHWQPENKQIYRVYTQIGIEGVNNGINLLAPQAIRQKVTGVSQVAHICDAGIFNFAKIKDGASEEVVSKWDDLVFADQNYFDLFPYKWLVGSPAVLGELNTIVLSESEVGKFFPGATYNEVVGRVISFDDSVNLTVSGIVADLKQHTDFKYQGFISLATFMQTPLKNSYGTISWSSVSGNSQCFVRLNAGADPIKIGRQVKALYKENTQKDNARWRQQGILQPLSDIHFNTQMDGRVSKASLRNLGVLALLLLLLAAINFINLSTARSTLRAKEIGVRKTFGSSNRGIIYQFLTETFVLTSMAALLAIILGPFLLHVFSGFVPEGLHFSEMFSPVMLVFLIITVVLVTFLAGLYPAFVLTRFKPVAALKNQPSKEGKSSRSMLRKILTVAQFVIAQVFLIVVVVVGKQIYFMMHKDLGFRKDAIISFYIPDGFTAKANSHKWVLMSDVQQLSAIRNISISSGPPTRNGYNTTSVSVMNNGKKMHFDNVHTRSVDDNYAALFGLKLLAGKNARVDTAAKIAEVMVNETFMHKMGVDDPRKLIGHYVLGGPTDTAEIVGVLKDFTTQNLHNPISPTVIFADDNSYGNMMSVLLDNSRPESWAATIAAVAKAFKRYYPNTDFDYNFYDESLAKLYSADRRLSILLKWATGLAIFISCLGLLGLVSFMTGQRTKEIGIRKVLGASVSDIIRLLSQSMLKLVLLACVIALPIAWYFSHKWLQGFAFKTSISWLVFVICCLAMLLISLMVLWIRTFKAARANPIESLKNE